MNFSSKVLTSILLVTSLSGVALANFQDVPSNYPYADAINYIQSNNIVQGYPDGTYRPDNTINRAEFTKIVIGANGYKPDTTSSSIYSLTGLTFSDIQAGAWYVPYLHQAVSTGVIAGYPDGTFKPQNNVNFAEAAKIIVMGLGYAPRPADLGPWYEPYVLVLSENNAIPTSITTFSHELTRGEMAEIIYRLKANITTKSSQTYDVLASNSGSTGTGSTGNTTTLSNGIVTLQGTYGGSTSSGTTDPGTTLYLDTQTYGRVNIGMPGFIMCADQQIYNPTTIGEPLEVHGNYKDGLIDICSSSTYYLKSTNSTTGNTTAGGSIETLPHTAGQPVYASCTNANTNAQMYAWFQMGIDTGKYGYYDINGNSIGTYSYMVPATIGGGGTKIPTENCTSMTQTQFASVIKDQSTLPQ